MKLRADTTARQSEPAKAEVALEREREETRQVEATLGQALGRREDLADDAAGFEQNEKAISGLQAELLRRREYVIPRREREIADAKRRVDHAMWADAEKELERAYVAQRKAATVVAEALQGAHAAVADLEAKRQTSAEAEARFRALVPEDVDECELPPGRDEPAWLDREKREHVAQVVTAGPLQPGAQAARRSAEAERERARSDAALIGQAVDDAIKGNFSRLERLPVKLQRKSVPAAEAKARELLAEIERRRAFMAEERQLDTRTAAQADAVRGRLERVRELAAEAAELVAVE